MGFLISITMIYNSLWDSPSRFIKIIISTILFWTFSKINNIFVFKFGSILNIELSAKFLTSKCNLRLNVIRKMFIKFLLNDLVKPMPLPLWLGKSNICFFVTVSLLFVGTSIVSIVGSDKLLPLINLTCEKILPNYLFWIIVFLHKNL